MRPTLEITACCPQHDPQVLALSLRAWAPVFNKLRSAVQPYVYKAFYPDGWRVRQTGDIDSFLQAERQNAWVAVEATSVVGWVGIRLHPEDRMGEIYIVAVDPDYQRRGIGSALVDHAIRKIREAGMEIAMVETGDDPGHAPSRATYQRAGFERWPVARYFRKL